MSTEKDFQDTLENFLGTQTVEETPTPESGVTVDTPPVTETPTQTPETPAPPVTQVAEPDYNKFLEESSGGLFKSVDDFKNSLDKVKNYDTVATEKDTIAQERDTYKAKAETDPFANDLVRQFNDLVKKGGNEHQIDTFLKINKLGDLNAVDPFELRVSRMVLVDGVSRATAERIVTKEYNLNVDLDDETLSDQERAELQTQLEDSKEMLKLASKDDLSKLEQYKAKISEPVSIPDPKAEALKQQAMAVEHEKIVKTALPKIVEGIKGIGDVSFGDDGKLNFDFSEDYAKTIPGKVETYLNHSVEPITPEKIKEAQDYILADYKVSHFEAAIKAAFEHGLNTGIERHANETHNPGGLHNASQPTATPDNDLDWMRKIATGQEV